MESNFNVMPLNVRRSSENERDVIQKTAIALAKRFKTDFIWIEEILHNTVSINSKIEKYIKTGRECANGVLSDFAIDASFRPSILEPLSVLGAKNSKKIFRVNDGESKKKYADNFTQGYYSRVLTTDEYEAHSTIYNCWSFSYAILRDLPPPDNTKIGKRIFGNCEEETLQSFKRYLNKQKEAIVFGDIQNRSEFSDYPWLEWKFLDGNPKKIILHKSLLKIDSVSLEEHRFFKDENERIEYSKKEQEKIVISPRIRKLPVSYTCGVIAEDKFEISELVKKRDTELREKLFEFRIFAINFLIESLAGKNRQDPVDFLKDQVVREFKEPEILALKGKNAGFFGLKNGTTYKHREENCFDKIIEAVNLFFCICDSRLALKIYTEFEEIFNFSKEIEGPHQLWLSYYDFLFLLSAKPEISGQLINAVTASCEDVFGAINRFKMIANRRGASIGAPKLDSAVTNSPIITQLNSYAKTEYGQTNLALPYLDEVLSKGASSKKATGVFLNNFRDYRPRNKKIPMIHFSKKQAKAIEVLFKAFQKDGYGLVSRSTLINHIYDEKKAKEIAEKSSANLERLSPRPEKGNKKKGFRNKIVYKHRYEWRLEKILFKATHPAWKYRMIQHGIKMGGEKTYRISFDFDRTT